LAALVFAFSTGTVSAAPVITDAVEPMASCLEFGESQVTLSGMVFSRIYFGPPGYGMAPEHDARERAVLLLLDAPVCVEKNSDSSSERDVIVIQLAAVHVPVSLIAKAQGHHVTVRGSLFHAISGHHRTPVLMDVYNLKDSH
jgi:hypothetical protein